MRKYLLNGSVIGALIGGWSVFQTTRKGPRNALLVLLWINWALSVAIAIATVKQRSQDLELEAR